MNRLTCNIAFAEKHFGDIGGFCSAISILLCRKTKSALNNHGSAHIKSDFKTSISWAGKDLNFRVLVDLKRIVAYICPFCSNMSSKITFNIWFFRKDKVQLICPTFGCHETCVTIAEKHDKYKFDIECPICGDNISYTTTKENFWNKPLLTYKCPVAGIDVFFAGEKDLVENMLNENTDMFFQTFSMNSTMT